MARATNAIVQLAADAVPIFADPAREYYYVARVRRHRRIKGGVRFSVLTNEDEEMTLDLRFVAPEVLRVRLYRPGEEPPLSSPMLVEGAERSADVTVETVGGKVVLTTSALVLKVVPRPFHFGVFDRQGRKLFVQQIADLSFLDLVALPLGYSRDAQGRVAFHESFELEPDEHLFGLGQQYGPLDKRGQRAISWTRDAMGTNTTNLTYHNIPFFQSSRGYGVFVHHSSKIVYELGFPSTITGSFRADDPYLDYFFIYGPGPKQILARYAGLTGRAPLPPLWSFGIWMSRCAYMNRAEVEEVVERARELGIPMDVAHVDPRWLVERQHHHRDGCDFEWDHIAFPDPEGFVRWLSERGVKLSLWENPYVYKDTEMYREALEKGYLALGPDGKPSPSLENPPGRIENVVFDFTNPRAVRFWKDKHRPYLRMGVAAFKTDYGEGVPEDARFFDGRTGAQVHNLYPLLYNRAVFEVIREEKGEGLVWARSGYAGSQRYPVHWVGDTQCSFAAMSGALRSGLSLSLSGIPFWSHDIGGFFNLDRARRPDTVLYIRWAQWGLLSSHSRFHGIREREPWYYGDDALRIVRDFARLRYRLLPYLWACAHEASRALVPVVRPMYLEFPDDPLTPALQHQYMLGPSLLVAPVLNQEGRCRPYLPAGRWYDFWSGAVLEGPCHLDLTVPLDRIPLYVRQDSIVPFAPDQQYVGQTAWDRLRFDVRVSTRAAMRVPAPEGVVEVRARRTSDALRLDLRASGQRLQVRLLDPAVVKDVVFSGDAKRTRWRQTRRGAVIELTVKGRAVVEAKLVSGRR
jgi:alpha-D-xyloside xylohydrolase